MDNGLTSRQLDLVLTFTGMAGLLGLLASGWFNQAGVAMNRFDHLGHSAIPALLALIVSSAVFQIRNRIRNRA